MINLQTPIVDAGRNFKMLAKKLDKLDIHTLSDLLYHLPSRYDDFSIISSINRLRIGEVVTIRGTVEEMKNEYTKRFKKLQRAKVSDSTGVLEVVWFNQPFLTRVIQKGDTISLSGRIEWQNRKKALISPDYEILTNNLAPIHTGRLVPVYPETKGLTSKWLRRQVYNLLQENLQAFEEFLPQEILESFELYVYSKALEQVHFPDSLEIASKARHRLAFDEVFLLQLAAKKRKEEWRKKLKGLSFKIAEFQNQVEAFWNKLPFELTGAQRRSINEIFADLAKDKPMNRLLEGDVGSGKTVVAAISMYVAHLNGYQSVLMAPTEILAQQHYATISKLLEPLGVNISLATGSKKINHVIARNPHQAETKQSSLSRHPELDSGSKKKMPKQVRHDMDKIATPAEGEVRNDEKAFDILVGTHAVLSENINFDRLGLVIIDEQQRFGVEQRSILRGKGENPHLLTMTATPIPRTVALTLYGDLELSLLDEMPKGRQKIKTWLVPQEKREAGYKWISDKILKEKDQVFIVCPFIEESESMQTIKAATKEFEILKKDIFPNLKLGLLHGKMKSKEKDAVLEEFRKGDINILVATPVVEVGIDIPNATIIVIEASERFGLSQLHQLRGRVGRGDKASFCLLFTESKTPQSISRLKALEVTHNGAELAELDLKLRGAGELYGTLQHGRKWLKIASFSDLSLIQATRHEAEKIFPDLSKYPLLLEKVQELNIRQASPD